MPENEEAEEVKSMQENYMRTMGNLISSYNPPTVEQWIDAGDKTKEYIKDSEQLMASMGDPQKYSIFSSQWNHSRALEPTFELFNKGLDDLKEMEEPEKYAKNFRTFVLNNGRAGTY